MRIVLSIIKFSLLLLAFGVIGFFVARELFLYWGVSALKRSLVTLRRSYTKSASAQECARRSADLLTVQTTVIYQLRFLNDKQYQLEAQCNQFSQTPIVIERGELPSMVTKVPGYSGLTWQSNTRTGVELAVFADLAEQLKPVLPFDTSLLARRTTVTVDNEMIVVTSREQDLSPGPATSCEGYGYQCCEATTQVGIGEQIIGLPECSENCFARCNSRPSILSFTSNPFFDVKTRTVTVANGGVVEFMYVSDAKTSTQLRGVLDFGDGVQNQLTANDGSASHVYACAQSECTYAALLKLIDQWGVESASTPLSRITVVVRSQ